MSKYILVYMSSSNPQWEKRQRVDIFEDFDSFKDRVDKFLELYDGSDAIVLAGEVETEWEFKPVNVVKSYQWAEKKG